MPPRLRLITWAGVGLAGTPAMGKPAAHSVPSTMSTSDPPPTPSMRTGSSLADQSTPATPSPSSLEAPIVPATWVPW